MELRHRPTQSSLQKENQNISQSKTNSINPRPHSRIIKIQDSRQNATARTFSQHNPNLSKSTQQPQLMENTNTTRILHRL
ncbi:MAG: hypothetical protein Gaeavirus22_8 [Gaeavirus sp.]|uniref:Uncharacterized protein n=1 Tax=Gaeavirus sp. TaxID=2487767 RepID=A0A3G4ZZG5_9VIRU|nr:MAG: hypothetical protein Gaeavirus22_8 [Gaeavirus sp.]